MNPAAAVGKSKRKGPVDHSEIPVSVHMHRDQTLYGDILFWHGEPLLIFGAKPMYLILCRYIPER